MGNAWPGWSYEGVIFVWLTCGATSRIMSLKELWNMGHGPKELFSDIERVCGTVERVTFQNPESGFVSCAFGTNRGPW